MSERLWHRDVRLPDGFVKPLGRVMLNYGSHARQEALADRYGKIALVNSLTLARFDVIEVGTDGDKVTKILFRGRLDDTRDLCIVMIPNVAGRPWFVKTLWVNLSSDQHMTLDTSRYVS